MDQYTVQRVLLVDDEVDLCSNIKAYLTDEGYDVTIAHNGQEGLNLFLSNPPDLMILDLHMPVLSGQEVLSQLSSYPHIPKLIISGIDDVTEAMNTVKCGGWDFISKPINNLEVIVHRVNQLADKATLMVQNKLYREHFNRLVEERIIEAQTPIIEAHKEIASRLSDVIEMRSRETGNHVRRVAQIAEFLALAYGLSSAEAETLRLAAPLHDIGKAGIPDVILNKNGKLVDDEFKIIKTHTTIGYEMLKDSEQPIIQAAATIALQHHEHWDGSGYPQGLAGEEIHIYGRITCLADIYDVLLQKRQHKDSWNRERALDYVKLHTGTFFDPELVRLFLDNIDEITDLISDDPKDH